MPSNRFESRDGHAAGLGFEVIVGDAIEKARSPPIIRSVRANAGTIGGVGLIAPRGFELGQQLAQSRIDLRRRIGFVARAPQGDRGVVAVAQNFVANIGHIRIDIGGIGTIGGVGLEEFVPHQDPVLVAQFIKIFAGALSHPVADHVEMSQLVHANFGLEPLARNALHGLIQTPIAAANKDRHAVDGNGESVGAGNRVGDFAHAEVHDPARRKHCARF